MNRKPVTMRRMLSNRGDQAARKEFIAELTMRNGGAVVLVFLKPAARSRED
jgi:hypothetical protein